MTDRRDIKKRLPQSCWGIFDIDGNWRANPHLVISADEQRRQNVAAGYMTEDGKRIKSKTTSGGYNCSREIG